MAESQAEPGREAAHGWAPSQAAAAAAASSKTVTIMPVDTVRVGVTEQKPEA